MEYLMIIDVIEKFTLNLAGKASRVFEKGLTDIEDALSSHWYVKAHSQVVTVIADVEAEAKALAANVEAEAKALEAKV
jgi:hypothetical protein